MIRSTVLAHLILAQVIKPGDWALDATVGNGHDTLFLADLVGNTGRVYGFDVQQSALDEAQSRLADYPQVTLYRAGHEHMSLHLPDDVKERTLSAVMFNLGYLPGADKSVKTLPSTTLEAIRQSLDHLKVGGLITLVLYPGHEGGEEEIKAVHDFLENLPASDFAIANYKRSNVLATPILQLIERRK